jgi:hypothetical protein
MIVFVMAMGLCALLGSIFFVVAAGSHRRADH